MRTPLLLPLLLAAPLAAQVPPGHFVFSTFGATGQKGLFLSHPRTPGAPTEITGLAGDLVITGGSCVVYRPSDGAVLVGERSPVGSSVDLHVIELSGTAVRRDASFSVGTGGTCCGEIPQMGLLPDGRVVVAATDIAAGPLSMYLTTSYGYQGIGIVDTQSGLITPVPIANAAQIVDVFNGLAVAPDGSAAYAGCWGPTGGEIWRVPLPNGGTATLIATLPVGLSNMAFDNHGLLWCTTLDATQSLFRVDVTTGAFTAVATGAGALNAIHGEAVSGNFGLLSATRGTPPKSVLWMEPDGTEHLLSSPGLATPSGVAIRSNPERIGAGTAALNTWDWMLAPNPGGLPEVGNAGFSLTVSSNGTTAPTYSLATLCGSMLPAPVNVLGADVWVDLSTMLYSTSIPPTPTSSLSLPIPNDTSLGGASLALQTFHLEGPSLQIAATPGLMMTIL
jgi:hypothetical protein